MTEDNLDELKAKARNPYRQFCLDLKEVCRMAGVEYKSPHKARYAFIQIGYESAKTAAQQKAISLSALHKSIDTTDKIYHRMPHHKQQNLVTGLKIDDDNEISSVVTDNGKELMNLLAAADPQVVQSVMLLLQSAKRS